MSHQFPLVDLTKPTSTSSSSTSQIVANPSGNDSTRARTRTRGISIQGGENPFETPLTDSDQEVANLIRSINKENEAERIAANKVEAEARRTDQSQSSKGKGRARSSTVISAANSVSSTTTAIATPRLQYSNMAYQNYMESAGPSNPRQAPPSPSQNMNHGNGMNGMNGAPMGIGGGMVGFPTPAGHQADLNYIMSMVEELSRTLEGNQRITSGVIEKIGKVSERARHLNLSNDQLINIVAQELDDDTKNTEKELSDTRKALEKADYNAAENWKLVLYACNILKDLLEKVHAFKENEERDVLTWHKNYRKQLTVERETNLELTNQINDMRAAAGRANEYLRLARRAMDDEPNAEERRIQMYALRLERRMWKRMALPLLPDDDAEWSGDDDLNDPGLRTRLSEIREEYRQKCARKLAAREAEQAAAAKTQKAPENENENDGGNDQGSSA